MTNNKLQNNWSGSGNKNGNIFVNKTGYCSKCLRELDMSDKDIVKDAEGNLFCDSSCRRDYHYENYREMDSLMREVY